MGFLLLVHCDVQLKPNTLMDAWLYFLTKAFNCLLAVANGTWVNLLSAISLSAMAREKGEARSGSGFCFWFKNVQIVVTDKCSVSENHPRYVFVNAVISKNFHCSRPCLISNMGIYFGPSSILYMKIDKNQFGDQFGRLHRLK